MKKIRFCTDNFWNGWDYNDNIFIHILKQKYDVIIDNVNPQIVVNATHKKSHKNAVSIYYTGESDWFKGENEYGFTGTFPHDMDKYYRFPLYLIDIYIFMQHKKIDMEFFFKKHENTIQNISNKKFACFMHRNGCAEIRNKLFHLVSKYKRVDSYGSLFKNMNFTSVYQNGGEWWYEKIDIGKNYKFFFAAENNSIVDGKYTGYVTEKLPQALMSGSIPIYYGYDKIHEDFNTKSFLHYKNGDNMDEFLQKIIEIDNDDEKYLSMLNENKINDNCLLTKNYSNLLTYFDDIIEKEKIVLE